MAAGGEDHAALAADVERLVFVQGGETEYATGFRVLNQVPHLVQQQDLRTLGPGAFFQRPQQAGTVPGGVGGDQFLIDRPLQGAAVAGIGAENFILKDHAVFDHPFEGFGAEVGVDPGEFAVGVAGFERFVAQPVPVDCIGRVLYAMGALPARAAAEIDPPAADHAMATAVVILLDDNDRSAVVQRFDRRRQTGGSGARDDDVGTVVPLDGDSGISLPGLRQGRQRLGADSRSHAGFDEIAPGNAFWSLALAHFTLRLHGLRRLPARALVVLELDFLGAQAVFAGSDAFDFHSSAFRKLTGPAVFPAGRRIVRNQ